MDIQKYFDFLVIDESTGEIVCDIFNDTSGEIKGIVRDGLSVKMGFSDESYENLNIGDGPLIQLKRVDNSTPVN